MSYIYDSDNFLQKSIDGVIKSETTYISENPSKKVESITTFSGDGVESLHESYTYNERNELKEKKLTGAVDFAYKDRPMHILYSPKYDQVLVLKE